MFLQVLCNDHHRRSFTSYCRKKVGSGKMKESAAKPKEEQGPESSVRSVRDEDENKDAADEIIAPVVYIPQTVCCHDENELHAASVRRDQRDETKSNAESRKSMTHEGSQKDENKADEESEKRETNSRIDRIFSSNSSITISEPKPKRVSLDPAEWDVSMKSSGIITSTTYTAGTTIEETLETSSTSTSKNENCVGATVDELGAVIFNVFPKQKRLTHSHKKGGIPTVISIRPEPVILTLDSPVGCFNPVLAAMEVGAALELAASHTFSTKHRQLQNVPWENPRSSRKRELRKPSRMQTSNISTGSRDRDSIGTLTAASVRLMDPLPTVMESNACQTLNTKQRQRQHPSRTLPEASRSQNRQREELLAVSAALAKQYAVRGVDHSTHQRGPQAYPYGGAVVPFAQCAVLEATKSMSDESRDVYGFGNPQYYFMNESVSSQSRS